MKHYDEKLESINIVEEKIEDQSPNISSSETNSPLQNNSPLPNDSRFDNNSLENKPNELLVALAMHPDTPEHEWLAACDALNKRNIDLPCKPPKRVNKKLQRFTFASIVCSFAIIGSAGGYYAQSYLNTPAKAIDPPYNRSAAAWQTRAISAQLATKVANSISEKGWSANTAAEQTGMDPKQVKELLDGKDHLSMEQKVKMLFAMDKPVRLLSGSQGWTRSSEGEYEKADYQERVNYYTRALNANPNDVHLLVKRADAYNELKQRQLALDDYNHCLQIDPGFEAALNNRANLYRSTGKYDLAIKDEDTLLQKNHSDWGAYMGRGLTYLSMNKPAKALADFNKAVELAPERPGPLCNRANAYEMLGKYKEAIQDWQKCLENDPTYSIAEQKITELQAKL